MLTLIRDKRTADAVLGRLYLGGVLVCYTCENRAKAIPAGSYRVKNSISPKFMRELPLIFDDGAVTASRGVRFHRGNSSKDSSGCVLCGMGRDVSKGTITESTAAETMVTMICRNVSALEISEAFT